MTTREIILALLATGKVRLSTMAAATGESVAACRTCISRLRDADYDIVSRRTETSGDPQYELLRVPGSLRIEQ